MAPLFWLRCYNKRKGPRNARHRAMLLGQAGDQPKDVCTNMDNEIMVAGKTQKSRGGDDYLIYLY